VLGVNKNTVLRALHILREEGLLEFRRGRGITVVGTPQRCAVLTRIQELIEFARHHGFDRRRNRPGHVSAVRQLARPRHPWTYQPGPSLAARPG